MKKTVIKLKKLLEELTISEVLHIVADREAIAFFPESKKLVVDCYFALDVPDQAAERYWEQFGPRAIIYLDTSGADLYEMTYDELRDFEDTPEAARLAEKIRAGWLAEGPQKLLKNAMDLFEGLDGYNEKGLKQE